MGRKRLPKGRARTGLIQMRVTPAELREVRAAANRLRLDVTAYLMGLHDLAEQTQREGRILVPIRPDLVEATIEYARQLKAERAPEQAAERERAEGATAGSTALALLSHVHLLSDAEARTLGSLPPAELEARTIAFFAYVAECRRAGKFPESAAPDASRDRVHMTEFAKFVRDRSSREDRARLREILLKSSNRAALEVEAVSPSDRENDEVEDTAIGKRKARPRRA